MQGEGGCTRDRLDRLQSMSAVRREVLSGIFFCFALQTIALLANLQGANNCQGPFLIVCPLSVLHNWQNEFSR